VNIFLIELTKALVPSCSSSSETEEAEASYDRGISRFRCCGRKGMAAALSEAEKHGGVASMPPMVMVALLPLPPDLPMIDEKQRT
jgi:hypothetical protein